MNNNPNYQTDTARYGSTAQAAEFDAGLRQYMLGIYNYMSIGLAITGLFAIGVAMMVANNPALAQTLYSGPLAWVIMLSPLAFILVMSFGINKLSPQAAMFTFFAFSAVMGVSISSIFLVYTGSSIAQIFFVTAAAFGSLSLYGYTTKRDLSGMGAFLIMGLVGLIIASIVNIFLASSMMSFVISVIGVLIFAGLTAYDNQRLKNEYIYSISNADAGTAQKSSVMGALSLYLNFINMFMFLLSLFGNRE